MSIATFKRTRRQNAHRRVRGRVSGTAARPRLAVFKSGRYVYAQLIDDQSGQTDEDAGCEIGYQRSQRFLNLLFIVYKLVERQASEIFWQNRVTNPFR